MREAYRSALARWYCGGEKLKKLKYKVGKVDITTPDLDKYELKSYSGGKYVPFTESRKLVNHIKLCLLDVYAAEQKDTLVKISGAESRLCFSEKAIKLREQLIEPIIGYFKKKGVDEDLEREFKSEMGFNSMYAYFYSEDERVRDHIKAQMEEFKKIREKLMARKNRRRAKEFKKLKTDKNLTVKEALKDISKDGYQSVDSLMKNNMDAPVAYYEWCDWANQGVIIFKTPRKIGAYKINGYDFWRCTFSDAMKFVKEMKENKLKHFKDGSLFETVEKISMIQEI